ERASAFAGLRSSAAAAYALGIRDREFRGGPEFSYRLQIGDIPVVTNHFPLGIQRGKSIDVHLDGVGLGTANSISVAAPEAATIGSRVSVPAKTKESTVLNAPSLVVGEFPELVNDDAFRPTSTLAKDGQIFHPPAQVLTLPIPGTGEGLLANHVHWQNWRFA